MAHKKFFGALIILVLLFAALLIQQIYRAATITTTPVTTPLIATTPVPISTTSTDPTLGNPGAPTEIIGFFDLGDATSNRLLKATVDFVKTHPQDMMLLWKALPNRHLFFDNGSYVHQAAYCANNQNKFWPFVEALLAQSSDSDKNIAASAASAGLDTGAWQMCLAKSLTAPLLNQSEAAAQALGITSAPALFINNFQINITPDLNITQLLTSLLPTPSS